MSFLFLLAIPSWFIFAQSLRYDAVSRWNLEEAVLFFINIIEILVNSEFIWARFSFDIFFLRSHFQLYLLAVANLDRKLTVVLIRHNFHADFSHSETITSSNYSLDFCFTSFVRSNVKIIFKVQVDYKHSSYFVLLFCHCYC
jgi:hypothetical protein